MARVHRLKGEYDRALDNYRRSYEMHQLAQPQRLISVAKSLNGIDIVYSELRNYNLAIEHLTQALKVYEENLSKNHPDIPGALTLHYLKRAQNINDRALPPSHPNHATTLNNFGNIHYKKGCYTQALDCYLKALPSDHSDLIRTQDNIGLVYYAMGQYMKAS